LPSPGRQRLAFALLALRLGIAIALLPVAIDWRSPLLASFRPVAVSVLIALPLLLIAIDARALSRAPPSRLRRVLGIGVIAVATTNLLATLALEISFQRMRSRVLAADAAQLEKLGRHLILGYRDPTDIDALIERRAIGGVFVSARNVEGLSAEAVRRRIDIWQEARRRQSLPPLWIATDQEGGPVSRLSPPLPRQPSLASVVEQHVEQTARAAAARDYGRVQGRGLSSLGVNLNFAPVVDLNKNLTNPNDRYTRIRDRAISGDPTIVTEVARQYCLGLWESGVRCTLKHFPGLGGVFEDTHLEAGYLRVAPDELDRNDWVPFRALMRTGAFTMLSHARLTALDAERPVSFSQTVVAGLLRGSWGQDGVLITDDFSMGAAYASKEGVGAASVAALDAGVDLILIAYDPAQYFPAMDALTAADRDGRLPSAVLVRSARRLTEAAR
jgi:beta-N-acetylhexosaminidase